MLAERPAISAPVHQVQERLDEAMLQGDNLPPQVRLQRGARPASAAPLPRKRALPEMGSC